VDELQHLVELDSLVSGDDDVVLSELGGRLAGFGRRAAAIRLLDGRVPHHLELGAVRRALVDLRRPLRHQGVGDHDERRLRIQERRCGVDLCARGRARPGLDREPAVRDGRQRRAPRSLGRLPRSDDEGDELEGLAEPHLLAQQAAAHEGRPLETKLSEERGEREDAAVDPLALFPEERVEAAGDAWAGGGEGR